MRKKEKGRTKKEGWGRRKREERENKERGGRSMGRLNPREREEGKKRRSMGGLDIGPSGSEAV